MVFIIVIFITHAIAVVDPTLRTICLVTIIIIIIILPAQKQRENDILYYTIQELNIVFRSRSYFKICRSKIT